MSRTTVHRFIDRGDSCESGPGSSIGEYDLEDNFINDNESVSSTSSAVPLLRNAIHSIERHDNDTRSTSHAQEGLFVSQTTRRSVESSSTGRHHRNSGNSLDRSDNGSESRNSSVPTNGQSTRSGESRDPMSNEGTPDPFEFPAHLDSDVRNNTTVPGKRLGSNRPRWANRHIMLTYAQAGLNWPYNELVDILDKLGAKHRIGRERHADGGYHFHCFIDFGRKFDFENVHKFCVGSKRPSSTGSCPGQTHCNILRVYKTPEYTWDYVGKDCPPPDGPPLKDGETLDERGGCIVSQSPDFPRPTPRKGRGAGEENWAHSLSLPTRKEFLDDIEKHSPRDSVIHCNAIWKAAKRRYAEIVTADEPSVEGLNVHWSRFPTIKRWVLDSLPNPCDIISRLSGPGWYSEEEKAGDQEYVQSRVLLGGQRLQSLILVGETRLGKTDFATNLGKHVHFHYNFDLKLLLDMGVENVEYAVFDDVSWKNSALADDQYKSWLGCQAEFSVTDKFRKKTRINWGKPVIYNTNKSPFERLRLEDIRWLQENCVIVDIGARTNDRINAISSRTIYTQGGPPPNGGLETIPELV